MIVTQHNDNYRTGANLAEMVLTTGNVNRQQFGKLFTRSVVGATYAQPLYLVGVNIPHRGQRDVLYVATMHNLVYAFDAIDPNAAAPLWGPVSLGPSVRLPDQNIGPGGYKDISVEVGILSTPVIYTERNALYVLAFTHESGQYFHRLHMLDVRTGQPLRAPATISGSVPGHGDGSVNGAIRFTSHRQIQRCALTLAHNNIYIAFASYGDQGPYHGWLFAYNADTLQQAGRIFNTTPNGREGGIWQAGQGPAVDDHGNLYLMSGNGTFNANGSELGDCIIKLNPDLSLADWFSPHNNAQLDATDKDLGAAGILLLPGTNLGIGGGKEGKLYVFNRSNLGKFDPNNDNQLVQSFYVLQDHHIHGSPVYWQGPDGPHIYLWLENDFMKAYKFANGLFPTTPSSQTTDTSPTGVPGGSPGMPGGFLSISANGGHPGTGIVWTSHPYKDDANQKVVEGVLRAFDASDLTRELWNSKQNPLQDDVGNFAKFCPPSVAKGRVYLATMGGLWGKVTLSEQAIGGPALANVNDAALALGWTGTDSQHRLNIMTSANARDFTGKVTLQDTSPFGPALAFGGGRLFISWTGSDSGRHVNVMSSPDCRNFANKVTLGETSIAAPALGWGNGRLFLAWTGTDSHHSLNVMSSADGINWVNKVTLLDNSFTGPALAFWNGKLYLLWAGTDNNHSLNLIESTDGIHFANKNTLGDTSDFHPALAGNATLHVAWTGRDGAGRLNLLSSESALPPLDYKATYDDASRSGPSLVVFKGELRIAWTGTDSSSLVNVASISTGAVHAYGLR